MMKVEIEKVKAHIAAHFFVGGSVLNNTVLGGCEKIEISYEIESSDDPARVAAVLTNARNGCFIRQAVSGGVPIEDSLTLNGKPFDFFSYPPLPEESQ